MNKTIEKYKDNNASSGDHSKETGTEKTDDNKEEDRLKNKMTLCKRTRPDSKDINIINTPTATLSAVENQSKETSF